MSKANINIEDIVIIVMALETAINKKTFTVEEINKYYPAWDNVATALQKFNRLQQIEKLYKEPEHKEIKADIPE